MKKCKECDSPVFGGGYCKYHQYRRKMLGGDMFARKAKPKKQIPKVSAKQKKTNKRYLERLQDFWDKAVETKINICFFCGELMNHRENIHHIRNRGKMTLEEEFWVLCHQECHMKYHFSPMDKLMQESWYNDFMCRLKQKDLNSYYKQKRKEEKSKEEEELF